MLDLDPPGNRNPGRLQPSCLAGRVRGRAVRSTSPSQSSPSLILLSLSSTGEKGAGGRGVVRGSEHSLIRQSVSGVAYLAATRLKELTLSLRVSALNVALWLAVTVL